jgi:hypothetical protein
MRIPLLFLLLASLASVNSKSQQVVFSEDFEWSYMYYPILGWQQQPQPGEWKWQTGKIYYLTGGCFMEQENTSTVACINDVCNMFYPNNNDVFMQSPVINMTNATGAWLEFDSYFLAHTSNGLDETATVEVSTDNGNSWSVIYQPVASSLNHVKRQHFNLSSLNNAGNIRLGFRYSDGGGTMKGWMVDNIRIYIPAAKDLQLVNITPIDTLLSYLPKNNYYQHTFLIYNNGTDTITSFQLNYKQGNSAVRAQNISGIAIPPFTYSTIIHPYNDTINVYGKTPVIAWVSTPGDTLRTNDTSKTTLTGTYFTPSKKIAIEEGTSTVIGYSPRGWVYMNDAMSGDLAICPISVHDADPMTNQGYSDFLFYFGYNYVPYFFFDRRKSVEADSFYAEIYRQKDYFGFADLHVSSKINVFDAIVDVTVVPAIDLSGDYRLVMVITEDTVRGTGSGYAQANVFTNNTFGPMGGFENKPDPVPAANMYYNHVARVILPSPEGTPGMLPPVMTHNIPYAKSFTYQIHPAWNRKHLKATVLLINGADTSILNSERTIGSLEVEDLSTPNINALVYPNPANENATLLLELSKDELCSVSVTDLMGNILFESIAKKQYSKGRNEIVLPTRNLANGIYLVIISGETGRKTLKLQVLR